MEQKYSLQTAAPNTGSLPSVAGATVTPINNITTNAPVSEEQERKLTPGRRNLRKWLGKPFRVVITDGRVLVGLFNCTDKDANIVLCMCVEYLEEGKDGRMLGNVMIPGKHVVSISVDMPPEEVAAMKLLNAKASTVASKPFQEQEASIITPSLAAKVRDIEEID